MKKLLIIILLLVGCTQFEIHNEIYPTKITIIGRDIGIVYQLGDLTISDTLYKIDKDKIEYLQNTKDELRYTLHIIFDGSNHSSPYFKYYINGIHFDTRQGTISENVLIANIDNIDNFFLYKLDGKEISEKNDEKIKEKIDEIKQEVKEEQQKKKSYGAEYGDEDSKW